jgi:hypothetical protein
MILQKSSTKKIFKPLAIIPELQSKIKTELTNLKQEQQKESAIL